MIPGLLTTFRATQHLIIDQDEMKKTACQNLCSPVVKLPTLQRKGLHIPLDT